MHLRAGEQKQRPGFRNEQALGDADGSHVAERTDAWHVHRDVDGGTTLAISCQMQGRLPTSTTDEPAAEHRRVRDRGRGGEVRRKGHGGAMTVHQEHGHLRGRPHGQHTRQCRRMDCSGPTSADRDQQRWSLPARSAVPSAPIVDDHENVTIPLADHEVHTRFARPLDDFDHTLIIPIAHLHLQMLRGLAECQRHPTAQRNVKHRVRSQGLLAARRRDTRRQENQRGDDLQPALRAELRHAGASGLDGDDQLLVLATSICHRCDVHSNSCCGPGERNGFGVGRCTPGERPREDAIAPRRRVSPADAHRGCESERRQHVASTSELRRQA
mmetsp:Transcript_56583/g.183982  ORF Transcript_56583/g.183982 Transcript_56583/m.183982 type:complete len:328 (-) Transcript_56583:4158-5141(-)